MIDLQTYRARIGSFNGICRKISKSIPLNGDELCLISILLVIFILLLPIVIYVTFIIYLFVWLTKNFKAICMKRVSPRLLDPHKNLIISICYLCLTLNFMRLMCLLKEYYYHMNTTRNLPHKMSPINLMMAPNLFFIELLLMVHICTYTFISITLPAIKLRGGSDNNEEIPSTSKTNIPADKNSSLNYAFAEVISGNFNQGHPQYRESAGIQCGVIVIYSICFNIIRKVSTWTSNDLDFILKEGSDLFIKCGYDNILALDELPTAMEIYNSIITLKRIGDIDTTEFGIHDKPIKVLGKQFVDMIKNPNVSGSACIINGLTYAIFKQSTNYYIFDSHSRSDNGQKCENGTAIVIKFRKLIDLTNYIKSVYRIHDTDVMQIQLFGSDTVDEVIRSIREILRKQQKNLSSKQRYHENFKDVIHKKYQKIIGTPEHGKLKTDMKERYKQNKEILTHGNCSHYVT